ncbi:hypothetical protein DTO166G4_4212 [Paecilomyces variotii]|nr:hypothetical protein DTO166G4_4212 [Paecilomyces variotii]KAJ9224171.1 hypothetical protein DTO169C6_3531 [Paecilomyces variotii]KAJ9232381.1 hypothetical protein DTO169E5_7505 [Paecilomyces variotii]KAJ9235150.1 hypothetical protein DTO166G5_4699 [Paecilomyces variotii]KAJ9248695.1 hypothetical protein DTO207G8_7179 [Paecilomyces variotii]
MFWSAGVEGTSMHPLSAQPRVLLTVLPASLRRCIPRLDRSLTTSTLTSTTSSTPDLCRGIVCSSEPQLQCYDFPPESVGYSRRPATATTAAGDDNESSSSCSGRSDMSIEMDQMVKYEVESGLRWNRIVPAFNLLRNAGYEAQQPRADSRLVRSLYINGLLYLLEALPADLTREETASIRDRLPETIASPSTALSSSSQNISSRNKYGRYNTTWNGSAEPSYLHRILAYSIIQCFLIIQLLSPYIRVLLQQAYQYERSHRITERVVTATLGAADSLGKSGVTAVLGFREGRLGAAVSELASWWIEGVTGGICEGVGEGLIILGAARSQTDPLGIGLGAGKESS